MIRNSLPMVHRESAGPHYLLGLCSLAVLKCQPWLLPQASSVPRGLILGMSPGFKKVIGTVSRWMPLAIYWGKLGMHFWTAVAFAYLFTVLECIRCALAGMYADIPFVCDAAYIQIPYD